MQALFQNDRLLNVSIEKLAIPLTATHLTGQDGLSQLFNFRVTVMTRLALPFEKILGKAVVLQIGQDSHPKRYHGIVYEMLSLPPTEENERTVFYYELLITPKLRLLADNFHSRTFSVKKNLTVAEIVTALLKSQHIPFKLALSKTYTPLPVCVQFKESDFNFISRLLESVGISYYFIHDDETHTLVLNDQAYPRFAKLEAALYGNQTRSENHIDHWERTIGIVPASLKSQSYDFKTPRELPRSSDASRNQDSRFHPALKIKMFDYDDTQARDPENLALQNILTLQAQYLSSNYITAKSNYTHWQAATGFRLNEHTMEDQIGDYYLEMIWHEAKDLSHTLNAFTENHEGSSAQSYQNTFRAHRKNQFFVPAKITPLPKMPGLQVASIATPRGEQVHTDEHGRVKLLFDWDEVEYADNEIAFSSDWTRIKQVSSNQGFGAQFTPRKDQRALVSFAGGDLNQPTVLGTLYDEAHRPPFNPKAKPTLSGIQTRSLDPEATSKGKLLGIESMGHQLLFEDNSEKPSITLLSQKDLQIKTVNNLSNKINQNATTTIHQGNYIEQVGETLKITAKKAVHFVNGQSRLSITDGDIIVEADEIEFEGGGATATKVVSAEAVVKPVETQTGRAEIATIKNTGDKVTDVESALRIAMEKENVPDEWHDDLHWIMMHESSGKVGVKCHDPKSSARGLFQVNKKNYHLNPNGEASFGNAVEECQGGIRYIKSRYDTPAKAKIFWNQNSWY